MNQLSLLAVSCSILCFHPLQLHCLDSDKAGNYHSGLQQAELHSDTTRDPSEEEDFYHVTENKKKTKRLMLSRTDQIPEERLAEENASYLEGYVQALLDAHFHELNVLVFVDKDHNVYLYNLPNDDRRKESIKAFVKDLPDIEKVTEGTIDPEIEERVQSRQSIRHVKGVWFPESTVLFPTLIANPRDPIYSLSYRGADNVLGKNQVAMSLGDIFPVFRWFDVLPWHGDLQIDISACVWGSFDMEPIQTPLGEWAELVTTDYMLAIPISYAFDQYAFRFRVYHISSHLGDENLINYPATVRLNPSFEAIDFTTAYQASNGLRLYLGSGIIIESDDSYPFDHFYFDYGLEYRFLSFRHQYHRLHGSPFLAIDVQQWEVYRYVPSVTAQLGYEWSKLKGAGRKVRLFAEYHNGHSEGQFFKEHSQYGALRMSWGF